LNGCAVTCRCVQKLKRRESPAHVATDLASRAQHEYAVVNLAKELINAQKSESKTKRRRRRDSSKGNCRKAAELTGVVGGLSCGMGGADGEAPILIAYDLDQLSVVIDSNQKCWPELATRWLSCPTAIPSSSEAQWDAPDFF